ncbi:dynamitin domain-containing protein [Sarocladium implicatum]|nr:dynamitin domain-containing protein [Sarocladium implicatum]
MTLNRKYANLPDLDSAPDIYETPELTDDNSTVPTTAARTQSDDEFYDVDEDDDEISRARLRIDEARSRFLPKNVNADGVDFSDRVDGKRKSYKASSRRQRILRDGTEELGDLSDDDEDDEGLERRIARLQREVQEAKDLYEKRKGVADSQAEGTDGLGRLDSLSQVLDEISKPVGVGSLAPTARARKDLSQQPVAVEDMPDGEATYTLTYAPSYEQTHALAKAADFDRRLLMLEQGLGISASSAVETNGAGLTRAMLPTLQSLEQQISTLAQASTANLDAISRRVRTLAADQQQLNEKQEQAKRLREDMNKSGNSKEDDDADQEAKINALYGTLPTIESLTPMLPPLLDRLRSLRAIHADAATASDTLDRIEQEQVDLTEELKQWREGLEKIEGAVKDGDTAIKGNMKVMEGWVKELEERVAKLA